MHTIVKSTSRWRTAAALVVSATVLAACGGGGASDVVGEGDGGPNAETTLTLVAFAVPEPGWSEVIPAFAATEEGRDVAVTGSYGGASGDQSRDVESGEPAEW